MRIKSMALVVAVAFTIGCEVQPNWNTTSRPKPAPVEAVEVQVQVKDVAAVHVVEAEPVVDETNPPIETCRDWLKRFDALRDELLTARRNRLHIRKTAEDHDRWRSFVEDYNERVESLADEIKSGSSLHGRAMMAPVVGRLRQLSLYSALNNDADFTKMSAFHSKERAEWVEWMRTALADVDSPMPADESTPVAFQSPSANEAKSRNTLQHARDLHSMGKAGQTQVEWLKKVCDDHPSTELCDEATKLSEQIQTDLRKSRR